MKTTELDNLLPGSLIYVPTDDAVVTYLIYPRVGASDYYTLMVAPDEHGEVSSKRPYYAHRLDLLAATTDKRAAWAVVLAGLEKRVEAVRGMIREMGIDEQINAASVA